MARMTVALLKDEIQAVLAKAEEAKNNGWLTDGAVRNMRAWLTEPRYADYAEQVVEHVNSGLWKELDDAFWTIIPFGTGGRRGRMYPIGSNAINDRTIGESAQGLAEYVKRQMGGASLSCAIAYDTRHNSPRFARLCAEIMVAAGFKVYFLDGYRSTPELSFTVRYKHCSCGIMVTASHNPPSDNAVKAYWSTGGQLLPPHDKGVIDCVMNVGTIARAPFDAAVAAGKIEFCQQEVDAAFVQSLAAQALGGPRTLSVIYSPLHGVGASAVLPVLQADGFTDVELFAPHADPNGDFPNVPGHVSNPENPRVFDAIIARAEEVGADLILASDPDCDRIGLAAPLMSKRSSRWATMTGNQIGALLTDYILSRRKAAGTLTAKSYIIKTLVTTELIRRIAESYGVRVCGDLQVGFKHIGGTIDAEGPSDFVFGAEESHGYLVGQYARDKDAAVAAMLIAELAAEAKAKGLSVHERLDALFWQHGCHAERQVSVTMPGSEGMKAMAALMARFREHPPERLAGMKVTRVDDYLGLRRLVPGSGWTPFQGPPGDMVMIYLERSGTYVAVRPSGTEPKVKYYMFTFEPAEQLANLDDAKSQLAERLDDLAKELAEFSKTVG